MLSRCFCAPWMRIKSGAAAKHLDAGISGPDVPIRALRTLAGTAQERKGWWRVLRVTPG